MQVSPLVFQTPPKPRIVTDTKVTVAFINPPHADWSLANVAAYLMFESHYRRQGRYPDHVTWLKPAYRYNLYKTVPEILDDTGAADIYLFSSYVWNYDLCDELATLVKSRNPDAICVIGGPQIGTNEPEFLASRTMYDFFLQSTRPGEPFVADLIDSYIENSGRPRLEDLTWALGSNKTCDQFMQDYSVYQEHISYLTEICHYAYDNEMEPFVILETTRGCPYQCSFCEWGGGIGSKIYRKPDEVVQADILALKAAGFRDAIITDANFGAFFERDVEIFRFAWQNNFNLTDISTMKSRDLKRRIALVDAWFDVVGSGPEIHSPVNTAKMGGQALVVDSYDKADLSIMPLYVSVVPTVSIQSVSDEAMRVAERVDLSFENKIKLSEHIYRRCQEEGFPKPAIELILSMPGSTLDDFYQEMTILWNFQAWTSFRHDYMFLPDAKLSEPGYLEKYNIRLVEVYTDLVDEAGVDNVNTFFKDKQTYFKTISSCYSFTHEEAAEMWFMNLAGNHLLEHYYPIFRPYCEPPEFGKMAFALIQTFDEFPEIWQEIMDILDPDTPARNNKRLQGRLRNLVIEEMLDKYSRIIFSELYRQLHEQGRLDQTQEEHQWIS